MQFTYGLTQLFGHGHAFTQNVSVPNPAAGAGFTYTVDSRYWQLLDAISFKLVTSNQAANRAASLSILDGGGVTLATVPVNNTVAASQTTQVTFVRSQSAIVGPANGPFLSPLPAILLQPSFTVVVTVAAIDTADQISNIRVQSQRFVTGAEGYLIGVTDTNDDPEADLARLATIAS